MKCKVINCKGTDIEYWTDGYCKDCYKERQRLKDRDKSLEEEDA